MKIICSWCKKLMGEKEPHHDKSETHGKCPKCLSKQKAELQKSTVQNGKISTSAINVALARIRSSIEKYRAIQDQFHKCDVSTDRDFQRRFNGFYRVRRSTKWQKHFYELMEQAKKKQPSFGEALGDLHSKTGRLEASFTSKLIATIDPDQPIIDQYVLKNFGLSLPAYGRANRQEDIVKVYEALRQKHESLMKEYGQEICKRFAKLYPEAKDEVSNIKKVDFVLWQSRSVDRQGAVS